MAGEQGQGSAVEAIGVRQAALSARHTIAADADRALVTALAAAHAATIEGIQRLDAISAAIDSAVAGQASLALDSAMGAREFQKFLLAKQQEISAVIAHARDLDSSTRATLDTLREHYATPTQD